MLVLSRKAGERIMVGGELTLTVLSIEGNRIRVGIDAPPATTIRRAELAPFPALSEKSEPRDVLSRLLEQPGY